MTALNIALALGFWALLKRCKDNEKTGAFTSQYGWPQYD